MHDSNNVRKTLAFRVRGHALQVLPISVNRKNGMANSESNCGNINLSKPILLIKTNIDFQTASLYQTVALNVLNTLRSSKAYIFKSITIFSDFLVSPESCSRKYRPTGIRKRSDKFHSLLSLGGALIYRPLVAHRVGSRAPRQIQQPLLGFKWVIK